MSPKKKNLVKKGSIGLVILSTIGTGWQQYTKVEEQRFKLEEQRLKLEEEKVKVEIGKRRQDQFEIFFSNEQDKIYCLLDSMKIKNKCN